MDLNIRITKTDAFREVPTNADQIGFGKVFAEHMFVADYDGKTWGDFRIEPYGNFSLAPSISALHYGQSIFEGMKAFKNAAGVSLFRPIDNAKRLNISAKRMMMPELPEEIFMSGLQKLIEIDSRWVPAIEGCSLYIRPFMFATDEFVGVRPSETYKFVIFSCPVGPYYSKPLKVKVEEHYSRAAKGGTGFTKCAGNYGGAMYPTKMAQQEGYDQVIWTDPETHQFVEETGTTNVFAVINGKIITPALKDSLLAGITRDSVLKVLQNHGYTTEERPLSIAELVEGAQNGNLTEMFITGTAATLISLQGFASTGTYHTLPEKYEISAFLKSYFQDLRTGKIEDPSGWMVPVTEVSALTV